ncbi:hypothetical protein M404DRAFT_32040 [Pisolithus tinctorius Marx 270]|uniref:Uncharacterized protein n=1 Tax=Pisolithus tinctorius Marx 270 TaxID=870435 RepID=A0A0C3JJC4_PISTI|nr:hypothetical protein M404DRAFT_32040 [Pisolithus tinctorius Marx 270]
MEEADNEWEAGGEDKEPATLHEGPLGVGVSSWWAEWEWEWQLQAAERYAEAHEKAVTAFERMAMASEWMAEAAEWTANEWGLYCGGWKRPQSEVVEDKDKEVDEGVEGDNEEEVKGEQEGGEEQEGGGEQAMEE